MKTVYDLTWRDCRWLGDSPGIFECSNPKEIQYSFCEEHMRRCYQPTRARVRLPHSLPVDRTGIPKPSKLATIQKRLLGPR
jgi:hypothetical protein